MPRDAFGDVAVPPDRGASRESGAKKCSNGPASKVEIDPKAPFDVAQLFLQRLFIVNGTRTLHHYRGLFYQWNGAAYVTIDNDAVRARLYPFLDGCVTTDRRVKRPVKPNCALVGNVADALRAAAHLNGTMSPPAWLIEAPDLPAQEIVSCQNGLLHLPTVCLRPHTPAFFTHNALDFAFEPSAPPFASQVATAWRTASLRDSVRSIVMAKRSRRAPFCRHALRTVGARRSPSHAVPRF